MNGSTFVMLVIFVLSAFIMIYSKIILILIKKLHGSINPIYYLTIVTLCIGMLLLALFANISLTGQDFEIAKPSFESTPLGWNMPWIWIGFVAVIITIAFVFSKHKK